MATHEIGKLKFNLSGNGLAWRVGDGETHRLFGRKRDDSGESEYDESLASQEQSDFQDDYSAGDEDYSDGYADDGYDDGAEGDYADDDYGDGADDGYADDGYGDGYADDGYAEDDYEDGYAEDDYGDDGDYYDGDYRDGYDDADGDYSDRYQDEDADDAYGDGGDYYDSQSGLMRYVDENDWVTYLLLFLFPPLGIYLLWRRNRFEKPLRWGLTAASAIWFVVALILLLRGLFGGTGDQQTQPSVTIAPIQVEVTSAPEITVEEPAAPAEDLSGIAAPDAGADASGDAAAAVLPVEDAAPSPTPLAGTASGGASTASYVWSPASGLYYHSTEDCPRIEEGVQVWRVTKEIAENSRHQSPCPDCIGGGATTTYYARADGQYYHSDSTCSGMRNAVVYTKEAAENEGKTPCPVCILKTQASLDEEENKAAQGGTVMISKNTRDKSGIEVYATKNGTYFHVKSDCRGMTGAVKGSLRDALLAGKKACPTCCASAGTLVYCTSGGKSYHTDQTCQGMTGAKQVTLAEAMVLGKTKCDVCIKGSSASIANGDGQTKTVTIGNATGDDVKVYATQNGTYYHTNNTCSGMKDAQLYTLKSMLLAGKKACPVCASSAETKVYATKGGKYYHSYATCSDMTDASSGTLAEALAAGYKRCPKCWGSSRSNTSTQESTSTEEKTGATAAASNTNAASASAKAAAAAAKVETVSSTKAQAAASKATASNTYVYATPTSKHYHLNSTCSGMTGASRVSLKTAINAGKTACTICAAPANRTVYSTSTGDHYHAASVCTATGMKNGTKRTLSEALMMGQTACAYCLGSKKAATQAVQTAKAIEKAVETVSNSATYKSGSSGVRVYASLTGKYYHTRSSCSNLSGDANRVTLETALNYGKTACPVCASAATRTVYATKGGKYYHYSKSDAGDGARKGTLASALAFGLDPCPNCVKRLEQAVSQAEDTYEAGTSGIKVYATLGSKYYHAQANCSGLSGASRVSLETALNYGKKACPVCLASANRKVYAVAGGQYYHYSKTHAGSGATAGTLAEARAYGLKACPLCTNLSAGTESFDNGGAQDAPVSTEQYAASADSGVYIDLGSANNYYHKSAKCSDANFSGGTKVTLQYALDWDYKACPYCKPPTSAIANSGDI